MMAVEAVGVRPVEAPVFVELRRHDVLEGAHQSGIEDVLEPGGDAADTDPPAADVPRAARVFRGAENGVVKFR